MRTKLVALGGLFISLGSACRGGATRDPPGAAVSPQATAITRMMTLSPA